jgi:KipI family sensor histidine kinase inhibitor
MRFLALGDRAIVAEFGEDLAPAMLQRVRTFAIAVEKTRLAGVTDVVPAFATVTVFYDAARPALETPSPHAHLLRALETLAKTPEPLTGDVAGAEVSIPVCYDAAFGLDLTEVAKQTGLSPAAVIAMHQAGNYRVHAIGFAPGFAYLAGLPEKLHTPRLATPRPSVPAGSLGIGGGQTGVYPLETPGGWRLIGRTPLRLFDAKRTPPALLRLGDQVKFRAISREEFSRAEAEHQEMDGAEKIGARGDTAGERYLLNDTLPIIVQKPGMLTTVQDLGRRGHRAAGVPLSGAADPVAARIANFLVGNSETAAVLEITLLGPELEFVNEAIVALGGATFSGLPSWRPVRVAAGTRLKLGAAHAGCRGYLAVAGGFQVESVLGSASTSLRGGFGGHEGRALREGDVLCIGKGSRQVEEHWRIDERVLPAYSGAPTVRVIRGRHAEEFGDALYAAEFKVTPQADRTGVRLSGPVLARSSTTELLSTAVAPGTIQVPPNGQPIVLLADAQTIGGYPQIAHVITVDLPLIAQLKPGDRVRFQEISLEAAAKLLSAREKALAILHEGLAEKIHPT